MKRYAIFDREDQDLPLSRLVSNVFDIACQSGCDVLVRRSDGYGETVNQWDRRLDHVEAIAVPQEELRRMSASKEEIFYNLDAECTSSKGAISFGVHDSTALFLYAPESVARKILVHFKDVRGE